MDQIRETLNKSYVPPAYIQGNWLVGCTQAIHEESIAPLPKILIEIFTAWASGASDIVLDLPVFPRMGSKGMVHINDA